MNLLKALDSWSEKHDSVWIDVLRMILGISLIIKGLFFMVNTTELHTNLELHFTALNTSVALLIAGIHLLAGFFILIGLATRLFCLLQIPILFAAIIIVNLHSSATELISSLLVFFLLILFVIKGSGKFSVYYYIANSRRGREVRKSNAPVTGAPLTAAMDNAGNLR